MIARGLVFWTVTAIATGVGLFLVKYQVQELEERLERTNRHIVDHQRTAQMFRVEWAHLNDIVRIERLNQKFLQLQPVAAAQTGRIETVPLRRDRPSTDNNDGKALQLAGRANLGPDAPSSTQAPSGPMVGAPAAAGGAPASPALPSAAPRARPTPTPTPPVAAAIVEPVTSGMTGEEETAPEPSDRVGQAIRALEKKGGR
jgi:hypothetical protein